MKIYVIGIVVLLALVFSSFSGDDEDKGNLSCNIQINELNDSTYVVLHSSPVRIEAKKVSGDVNIQIENDTIKLAGDSYVIGVYIVSLTDDCAKTELLTKLN